MPKDTYLKSQMKKGGYIPLSVFVSLSTINNYTDNYEIICQAVMLSNKLVMKVPDSSNLSLVLVKSTL